MEQKMIMQVLDTVYEKALDGLPGSESIAELAEAYLKEDGALDKQIDDLIFWQAAKTAASGFITGLGGMITLPVAIPADLTATLYVQLRMCGAIAYMKGYDVKDDRVKTFIFACICGSQVTFVLKKAGVDIGKKLTARMIKSISQEMLLKINQTIGFRLVTKAGSKGIANMAKLVPVAGGIINGGLNGAETKVVGEAAKKVFNENSAVK